MYVSFYLMAGLYYISVLTETEKIVYYVGLLKNLFFTEPGVHGEKISDICKI